MFKITQNKKYKILRVNMQKFQYLLFSLLHYFFGEPTKPIFSLLSGEKLFIVSLEIICTKSLGCVLKRKHNAPFVGM